MNQPLPSSILAQDGAREPKPPSAWFTAAIQAGRAAVMNDGATHRLLGVLSTPCDSPIAGLITLGLQIQLLIHHSQNSRTVDRKKHFARLCSLPPGTRLTYNNKKYELNVSSWKPALKFGETPPSGNAQLRALLSGSKNKIGSG